MAAETIQPQTWIGDSVYQGQGWVWNRRLRAMPSALGRRGSVALRTGFRIFADGLPARMRGSLTLADGQALQFFEPDADYAEALWALDQAPGTLDLQLMLRDTLAALEQLPEAAARLRRNLPNRAHPVSAELEPAVRRSLLPAEAYNMVPGRDPKSG